MGEMEIGNCCVCGKTGVPVRREYYRYPIKCQCHSGSHFIIMYYCKDCRALKEPVETKITLRTEDLKDYKKFKSLYIKD